MRKSLLIKLRKKSSYNDSTSTKYKKANSQRKKIISLMIYRATINHRMKIFLHIPAVLSATIPFNLNYFPESQHNRRDTSRNFFSARPEEHSIIRSITTGFACGALHLILSYRMTGTVASGESETQHHTFSAVIGFRFLYHRCGPVERVR